MDKDMFLKLYNSLVRPILNRVAQSGQLQNLSNRERLKYLGLKSLQYRRLRINLVETFIILNGGDKVECFDMFSI